MWFLVHRLVEHNEFWHDDGHQTVAGLEQFCPVFPPFGGQKCMKVHIWHIFVRMRLYLAALGVWPFNTYSLNLVNFGQEVPQDHAATCISPSLMHLLLLDRIARTTYIGTVYCYRPSSMVPFEIDIKL